MLPTLSRALGAVSQLANRPQTLWIWGGTLLSTRVRGQPGPPRSLAGCGEERTLSLQPCGRASHVARAGCHPAEDRWVFAWLAQFDGVPARAGLGRGGDVGRGGLGEVNCPRGHRARPGGTRMARVVCAKPCSQAPLCPRCLWPGGLKKEITPPGG